MSDRQNPLQEPQAPGGNGPRARSFLRRRLAPGEYLGLHLTVGLFLVLLAVSAFGFVAHDVTGQGAMTRFDERVAQAAAEHARTHPEVLAVFGHITHAGDELLMKGLALGLALGLFLGGHRVLGLGVLVAIIGGALIDVQLKEAFHRARPPHPSFPKPRYDSFPSGHSMGSLIGYGMVAYLMVLNLRRQWARAVVVALLGALVLAIGVSRFYLRAHWFSDVVAGYAAGTAWLAVCISGFEVIRRRRLERLRAASAVLGGEPRPQNLGGRGETPGQIPHKIL